MKKNKLTTRDLCIIAIMAAITAVMSQLSIPMPLGVPITMQTFAVILTGIMLGSKNGCISMVIYLLLGAVGLPVFASFKGGFQNLIGPTGGFLLSFPLMAFLSGLAMEHREKKTVFCSLIAAGLLANYAIGIAVFCIVTGSPVMTGFTACVLPFIPTDLIKTVLAAFLGLQLRKRLQGVLKLS